MNFPADLRYTKDHEWIRVDGNSATIGITDYAQGELGDIIYVDVAAEGKTVNQGDSLGTIEAVKTVSDLFAPVAGAVAEFNKAINDAPETVNKDPYGEGWMVKMTISGPEALDGTLNADEYKKLIGQ